MFFDGAVKLMSELGDEAADADPGPMIVVRIVAMSKLTSALIGRIRRMIRC